MKLEVEVSDKTYELAKVFSDNVLTITKRVELANEMAKAITNGKVVNSNETGTEQE